MLTVTNLGRRIGDSWIWKELSFELHPGESLGLEAPSGGGKTLLLRTLAGLDPIFEGDIAYQSRRLDDWFIPEYRTQVTYLHQSPAFLEGTVEDNLRYPFRFAKRAGFSFDRDAVIDRLVSFRKGADFLTRPVEALSGGEAQVVAFLRALQFSPQVLLLDEPASSLDQASADRIERLIIDWKAQEPSRSLILTSHNAEQLARMTSRRLKLRELSR